MDWKVGRILAPENTLDIPSSLPVVIKQIEVVDDQSAQFRYTARTAIDRRHMTTRGQIDNETEIVLGPFLSSAKSSPALFRHFQTEP